MTNEELTTEIKEHIQVTEEYDTFLVSKIKPKCTNIGKLNVDSLHFFNLGYKSAMQEILQLIQD